METPRQRIRVAIPQRQLAGVRVRAARFDQLLEPGHRGVRSGRQALAAGKTQSTPSAQDVGRGTPGRREMRAA